MSAYSYGPADRQWSSFGTEQQASIVAEWFAGDLMPAPKDKIGRQREYKPGLKAKSDEEANKNPYYRYIRDNIRAGIA
jgi:hypothetical protein